MPPAAIRVGVVGVCLVAAGAAATVMTQARSAPNADGKALYEARCANCHGAGGTGDGPASDLLAVKPRDFTKGIFKLRSTVSGSLPTDDDLMKVVADGIPGTSMIAWKDLLPEAERRAVVTQVKSFSPRFAAETPQPVTLAPEVPATPASIEAGSRLYVSLQCGTCHGEAGRLSTAVSGELDDAWGNTVAPAALTEPWSFRGGSSTRDIALRLKGGLDGTPMPALADMASDQDIWNVANYVRSLARKPVWEMTADELKAHYEQADAGRVSNPVERGRELAQGCAHCHSSVDSTGRVIPGMKFAGGMRMKLSVWHTVVTANLTSDKETGLGSYTDDEILRAVTKGIRRDGQRMLPFPMGWTAFAHLSSTDQKALVAFLRTIPPVRNKIPPRVTPGLFTYLHDKFRMLVLGADDPMLIHYGNAGTMAPGQAGK